MYPDQHDVELALRGLAGPRPDPASIWKDVVLVRSFLDEARGYCFNHGRHQFILVSELKKTAEEFIGHAIPEAALQVAIRMQNLQVKPSGADKQPLVKLPPLDRFGERRELWNQHMTDLEKEIATEVGRMEQERQMRARATKSE